MEDYYLSQSIISDPRDYQWMFADLPSDISVLRACVSQLYLHYADAIGLHFKINKTKYLSLDYRFVSTQLAHMLEVDRHYLIKPIAVQHKLMGICRDSALMLCSILRSQQIPARLRCGFINYYKPNCYLDGFCVQYFDTQWKTIETRTSAVLFQRLSLDFELTNVPNDRFITAAKAWLCYRQNQLPADQFKSHIYSGEKIIRNRLILDFLCLLKVEPLIWDIWGDMNNKDIDYTFYDVLAELIIEGRVDKLIAFYWTHSKLQISEDILVDNPFHHFKGCHALHRSI